MNYRRAVLIASVVTLLGVTGSHAQEPPRGDLATANALFEDGRKLSEVGHFAEACARFAASMALVPRLGVQFNLARCYEHLGRTASAWVAFGEAAALARRMADPREADARELQAKLVSRLSRLVITVSAGFPIEDLTVTRDGVPVLRQVYGVAVPVDPGVHTVEATAPGRIPWSTRLIVSTEGDVVAVTIPTLMKTHGPAAPPPPKTALGPRRPTLATWIGVGAAIASIGSGAYFGLSAWSLWQDARQGCDRSNVCTEQAYAAAERSRRDGTISTALFATGGAALVTGVVLYLRSPRTDDSHVKVVPTIARDAVGVAVGGGF